MIAAGRTAGFDLLNVWVKTNGGILGRRTAPFSASEGRGENCSGLTDAARVRADIGSLTLFVIDKIL
jgi:hypothetical protein